MLLSRALSPRSIQIKQIYENKWTKAIKRYSSCSLTLKSLSTKCNCPFVLITLPLPPRILQVLQTGSIQPAAPSISRANEQSYLPRGTAQTAGLPFRHRSCQPFITGHSNPNWVTPVSSTQDPGDGTSQPSVQWMTAGNYECPREETPTYVPCSSHMQRGTWTTVDASSVSEATLSRHALVELKYKVEYCVIIAAIHLTFEQPCVVTDQASKAIQAWRLVSVLSFTLHPAQRELVRSTLST